MSLSEVVVRGMLKADGTLELVEAPPLAAGPGEVTIRPLAAASATQEDWWQYLQRARRELEAMGHRFASGEQVNAYIEDLRSDDEPGEEAARTVEEAEPLP